MRKKLNLVTIVGLVLGLVAVVLVFRALKSSSSTEDVYVASSYIAPRSLITASDVREVAMATADVPAGTVGVYNDIVGHYAAAAIFPDQTFLDAALGTSGTAEALVAGLSPNERAFAVAANIDQALAGQIAPGDEVDVLVAENGQSGVGSGSARVSTIIQHVTVLTVNTTSGTVAQPTNSSAGVTAASSGNDTTPGIYTLALTPAQVETVTLAETVGTIYLALDPLHHPSVYTGPSAGPSVLANSTALGPSVAQLDPARKH